MSEHPCATCGHVFTGRFCPACGSRVITSVDLGIKPTLNYVLREADIPQRIGRTLWTLFAKPGELTRAYVSGAVGLYAHPVRLLLAAVAVYFLIAGPYWLQVNVDLGGVPTPEHIATDDLMLEVWQEAVINVQSVSRLLGPILLCLVLPLLRIRQREQFGHHLIFSVHYYCFDYVWAGLLAGMSFALDKLAPDLQAFNWWLPIFGGLWIWLVFAVRRAYAARWWVALLLGTVLLGCDLVFTGFADGIALGYANAQFAVPGPST